MTQNLVSALLCGRLVCPFTTPKLVWSRVCGIVIGKKLLEEHWNLYMVR